MVEFNKTPGNWWRVFINKKRAGSLDMKEDGYYDWYPELTNSGYIPAHILRAIADKLDELNKEWDEQVQRDVG